MDGLAKAVRTRILVLDGGMGTRLIERGLHRARTDPSLWCLDRPKEVGRVHSADAAAGADLLLTNTFGANRAWLARYGRDRDVGAVNREAVRLARAAARGRCWVAGDLGPTALVDVAALVEQAEALAAAGADALILEAVTSEQAEAGRRVLVRFQGVLPVMISLVGGHGVLSEWTGRALTAVGTNCASLQATVAEIEGLGTIPDVPLLAKPACVDRAGLVTPPKELARAVPGLVARGVRLVGGCCGAGSEHVRALRGAVDRLGGSGALGTCGPGPGSLS